MQFDQFFPPELARELESNPRLLEGQEREVTVMFGDIRGFLANLREAGAARHLQSGRRRDGQADGPYSRI